MALRFWKIRSQTIVSYLSYSIKSKMPRNTTTFRDGHDEFDGDGAVDSLQLEFS
ncbi:MAG: hypothetical protein JRN52_15160 [Nitrososphaerota archaeon]|nr:hypothetical protein [Nitrososphaerota archaeon]